MILNLKYKKQLIIKKTIIQMKKILKIQRVNQNLNAIMIKIKIKSMMNKV